MTYNDDHNKVNNFNKIDLNDLYNLNRCLGGQCIENTFNPEIPIPTLQELVNDRTPNPVRNQILQSAKNETAFADSSPVLGDPEQMYKPITKEESDLYPTPAVVQEEIKQNDVNNPTQSDDDSAEDLFLPYEVTRESLQYLNGFIRTQIGRRVTIDFLIGSGNLQSKTGYLLAVAQNYLLLNELDTNDVTACDLYTLKFIRFYY